jgi:hypothetical protein
MAMAMAEHPLFLRIQPSYYVQILELLFKYSFTGKIDFTLKLIRYYNGKPSYLVTKMG